MAENLKRAAGRREVLTRRNVRKPGMSGPVAALIAVGSVVVVGLIGYGLMRSVAGGSAEEKLYHEAAELHRLGKNEEAIAMYREIPEGAGNYSQAQQRIAEIQAILEVDAGHDATWFRGGFRGRDGLETLLKGKVAKGDPSEVRYFVYRCEEYLKKYGTHEKAPEVKAWLAQYKPQVQPGPPTWHDIEVQADNDKARKHYGEAWTLLEDFIKADPNGAHVKSARFYQGIIVDAAKDEWKMESDLARKNIEENELSTALGRYERCQDRFRGLPDLEAEAKRYAEDLRRGAKDLPAYVSDE